MKDETLKQHHTKNAMKETRIWIVLLIMGLMIAGTIKGCGQSFYAYKNHPDMHELAPKLHKKKLTTYHKRSLLYKIRREKSYSKKRKQAKTSA